MATPVWRVGDLRRQGSRAWDGDDWELFFATQRQAAYHQLCLGPKGKTLALSHPEEQGPWEPGVVTQSDTGARDRWTISLALPLDKLTPGGVQPGGKFLANFYRGTPNALDRLAWSPTYAAGFQDTARLAEFTLQ